MWHSSSICCSDFNLLPLLRMSYHSLELAQSFHFLHRIRSSSYLFETTISIIIVPLPAKSKFMIILVHVQRSATAQSHRSPLGPQPSFTPPIRAQSECTASPLDGASRHRSSKQAKPLTIAASRGYVARRLASVLIMPRRSPRVSIPAANGHYLHTMGQDLCQPCG